MYLFQSNINYVHFIYIFDKLCEVQVKLNSVDFHTHVAIRKVIRD